VRIHTGARAAGTAAALRSHAFAYGPHVVFGRGEYRPGTAAGRRLLAHELAHAVTEPPGTIHRTAYSDCSAGERPELEAAVSRAWSWLGTAYAMLREEPTPDRVRFALQLAFRSDSAEVVERVKEVITDIMQGLPSATIECENPGGAEYWWFCDVQEAQGFVRRSAVLLGAGNIHVCMGEDIWGGMSDERRAHVVIHEAAHRYGGVLDQGYFSQGTCLDSADTLGLAPGELLNNADSYACFIYLVLHHGEGALRGFLADRAGYTLTFTQNPPGDVDLRSGREHDPWFTVGIPRGEGLTELPGGFSTRFYLIDDAYNEYAMQSLAGPVAEFGTDAGVFIPAATRAQLIASGVRTGRVIAQVRLPQITYMFEVRVNFRY